MTGSLPTRIFPCLLRIYHPPTAQFSVRQTTETKEEVSITRLLPARNCCLLNKTLRRTQVPRLADENIQQIHGVIDVLHSQRTPLRDDRQHVSF
jgi:hypothetical protein